MATELLTLQAFIAALAELDSPLALEVQKQVNEVGQHWKDQPTSSAEKLIEIARSYRSLMRHYVAAERALLELYRAQSKYKCTDVPEQSNQVPASQNLETHNISATKDKFNLISGGKEEQAPENTESLLVSVLNLPDSVQEAKRLKENITKQAEVNTNTPNKSPENSNLFIRIFDGIENLINFGRKEAEAQRSLNNPEQASLEQSSISKTVYYVWVSTIF